MAKKQGRRGKKGAKGTKGTTGAAGKRGPSGTKGAPGLKGATGSKGATGPIGRRGATSMQPPRQPQFTGLYNQIERIYQELDIQMKRMAQLQAELNEVRTTVQKIAATESN